MSQIHNFGAASFTNIIWIANKRVFPKPKDVNVEFLTGGEWDWVISDTAGTVVKTVRHNGPSGWTSINFPSLGLYDDYSIGFRNASSGQKKIRGGDVTYD
jgi:hypothetical protein